jgi:hypothetical protein
MVQRNTPSGLSRKFIINMGANMKKWTLLITLSLLFMVVIAKAVVKQQHTSEQLTATTVKQNISETRPVQKNVTKKWVAPVENSSNAVRGIYATSWISGSKRMPDIIEFIKQNKQINAIVIDVKDDTGVISFIQHSVSTRNRLNLQTNFRSTKIS